MSVIKKLNKPVKVIIIKKTNKSQLKIYTLK